MTPDEIFEGVRSVLEESLGVAPGTITPAASLAADLGADSLDVIDIVVRLNRRFSLKLSAKELGEQLREGRVPAMAVAAGETFSSGDMNGSMVSQQLDSSHKTADLVTVGFLVSAVDNYLRTAARTA